MTEHGRTCPFCGWIFETDTSLCAHGTAGFVGLSVTSIECVCGATFALDEGFLHGRPKHYARKDEL